MFGFIRTLFWVFFILLLGIGFFFWNYRVPMTSHLLSTVLHNKTSLADLDISVSLSGITAKQITLANPRPSPVKEALSGRFFEIKGKFTSFFKQEIIIEEIILDHVLFFVDLYNPSGSDNNWKTILQKMETGKSDTDPFPTHKKRTFIRKIVLRDVTFSYRDPFSSSIVHSSTPQDLIEITHIGGEFPLSTSQVFGICTRVLLTSFMKTTSYKDLILQLPPLSLKTTKGVAVRALGSTVSFEEFVRMPKEAPPKTSFFLKNLFPFGRKNKLVL